MMLTRSIVITSIALLVGLGACGSKESAPLATYTVRGEIKSLPGADGKIYIHHEAIPTFVNRAGATAGMRSMSMPFGVPAGVSLDGLEPGDKIELTFAVDWDADPPTQLKSVHKLPPETSLELANM